MSRLILSVFDFFLCVVLVLYGTPCLQWFRTQSLISSARSSAADGNQGLKERLDAKKAEGDKLQGQTVNLTRMRPDIGSLEARRRQLEREQAERQAEFSATLARIRSLQAEQERLERAEEQADKDGREAERLARELWEKQQGLESLQSQIREAAAKAKRAEFERPVVPVETTPIYDVEQTRLPLFVALIEGAVTPVEPPHYEFSQYSNARVATLKQRGDAVDQALAQQSEFVKLIGRVDAKRQFVFLLVDGSSFETFRTVREFLRKRDVPFGWYPVPRSTIVFSNDANGAHPGTNR
jgi:predicted RNase H-like nuclease (RuvC/YqgF family)